MDRPAASAELRRKLASGQLLTGMCSSTCHPAQIEIAGRLGADFVVIDGEHPLLSRSQIEEMVRAADAWNLVAFVKLPHIAELDVRDALDAGAHGIIAPHTRSAEDVRNLCDWAYFPPRGKRGLCTASRGNAFSSGDVREFVRFTNEQVMVIPMIEDGEALARLDEILAVDERLDVFEIGPVDLALSLGLDLSQILDGFPAEYRARLEELLATLKRRGKHIMWPTAFPNQKATAADYSKWLRERQVSLVYGHDTHSMVRGTKDVLSLKAT